MPPAEIYRRRHAELFVALGAAAIGYWLIRPEISMATPSYADLLETAAESTWGAVFLVNGLIHALALQINGHRWWTPFIRLFACAYSAALYGAFIVGFWVIVPDSTAIPTYTVLGFGMAASCTWQAFIDCRTAMRLRHARIV